MSSFLFINTTVIPTKSHIWQGKYNIWDHIMVYNVTTIINRIEKHFDAYEQ